MPAAVDAGASAMGSTGGRVMLVQDARALTAPSSDVKRARSFASRAPTGSVPGEEFGALLERIRFEPARLARD
jgi:hypothetical protein